MNRKIGFIWLVGLLMASLLGQEGQEAARRRALTEELIELTVRPDTALQTVEGQLEQFRLQLKSSLQQSAKAGLQGTKDLIELRTETLSQEFVRRSAEAIQEFVGSEDTRNGMIGLYEDRFTVEELEEIVEFHRRPAGRKWLDESQSLVQAVMTSLSAGLQDRIQGQARRVTELFVSTPLDIASAQQPEGSLPARIELISKEAGRHKLIVPDSTSSGALKNLLRALSSNHPSLKTTGIELGMFATGRVEVFTEADRQVAGWDVDRLIENPEERRSYREKMVAFFQRSAAAATVATLGYPGFEKEVVIESGPGVKTMYQELQQGIVQQP